MTMSEQRQTVFGMFPVTCPVCSAGCDQRGERAVAIGFLDHTLRFGDPIIRAAATGDLGVREVGVPLTADLDDITYLNCTEPDCGRQFGPYTARDLRHRLLRSWS